MLEDVFDDEKKDDEVDTPDESCSLETEFLVFPKREETRLKILFDIIVASRLRGGVFDFQPRLQLVSRVV